MKSQRIEIEKGVFIDRFEVAGSLAAARQPSSLAGIAAELDRKSFNPTDWYWQIKGDVGFVWSSGRNARVPIADLAFQAWLGEGGSLTYIASIEEMRDVWAQHGMIQDPAAQYRMARKQRYIEELRKPEASEEPSFENTVGDVLDILLTQVEAMRQVAGAPPTPEFAALIQRIQQIKSEVPKPAEPK
ncbi:hypothetical protein [Dongia deserti]|uniref:hypothetical protein n=1 Tax=Dongia deserti TaxID=2268030 RepID=UPI000E657B9E|nr:hypothetical protein [Dongia deserti]